MTTKQANKVAVTPCNEADTETIDLQEIHSATRQLVQSLYEQAAAPEDISYTLAYVAAEFGLWYTGNSFRVFPIVLKGLSDAGYEKIHEENEKKTEFNISDVDAVVPDVVH